MNDTGPAKLPGLARVSTGNSALDGWIQAVSERLEVREGGVAGRGGGGQHAAGENEEEDEAGAAHS